MILRSLKVSSFGHLNPGAAIPKFSEGITVIHGPNETGKSTLLRGLTYALYQRHGVSGEDVEGQIVPVGLKVTPVVEIVFERGQKIWRLRKQFFKKATSVLEEASGGGAFVPIADNAEADEKVRELLGASFPGKGLAAADRRGLGEILIVDQGALRFGKGLGDRAREGLRGVIEDVGTTGEAHGILKAVRDRYLEVFTPTGAPKKGSDIPKLEDDLERIRAALVTLLGHARRAADLEGLLAAGDDSGAEDSRIAASLEADVKAARERQLEHLRLKADSDREADGAAARRREADGARKRCEDLARATADRSEAEAKTREAEAEEARRREERERQEKEHARCEESVRAREAERAALDRRRQELEDARKARAAAESVARTGERLRLHDEARAAAREHEEALAARLRPAREQVAEIRRRVERRAAIDRELAALRLRVRVVAERDLEIEHDGRRQALGSGAGLQVSGTDPLDLVLPGIARLTVSGPPVAARDELASERDGLERELRDLGAPFGTLEIGALEALEAERVTLERALEVRRGAMAAIFPRERDRADAARRHSEDASVLRALCDSHPEWNGEAPAEAEIAGREQVLGDARRAFDAGLEDARKLVDERRRLRDEAVQALDRQTQALATLRGRLSSAEGTLVALRDDGQDDAARVARARELEEAAVAAEARARRLAEEVLALGDPEGALRRADGARRDHENAVRARIEARGGMLRELEMLREQGLHGALARAEEEEAEILARLERAQLDAAALKHLQDLLSEEQRRAVEAVLAPVSQKVHRLSLAVFGTAVRPRIGANLVPEGLELEGRGVLDLPQLSAGAQDQLALLTRLAFGELLGRSGGRHLFVLDDPLVNCDRDRRNRLLDILVRATKDLQIVVLTCHPDHYYGLPEGRSLLMSLDDARRAFSGDGTQSAGA